MGYITGIIMQIAYSLQSAIDDPPQGGMESLVFKERLVKLKNPP